MAGIAWDESTVGILSVLVFGAGTDYALLLISRYRDELKTTESRHAAMAHALARTTEAVCSSAITVVLGLLTLLLSVIPTTRGLGVACAVGVVVAATFALVVLPAALVLFGRWVFWPFVPRLGGESHKPRSGWARLGELVDRRRLVSWALPLVVLGFLTLGLVGASGALPQLDQFARSTPDSVTGAKLIDERFPGQGGQPVRVMSRPDVSSDVLAAVQGTPGVATAETRAANDDWVEIIAIPVDSPESAGDCGVIAVRFRFGSK